MPPFHDLNQRQLGKLETHNLPQKARPELSAEKSFEKTHASEITQKAVATVGTI